MFLFCFVFVFLRKAWRKGVGNGKDVKRLTHSSNANSVTKLTHRQVDRILDIILQQDFYIGFSIFFSYLKSILILTSE